MTRRGARQVRFAAETKKPCNCDHESAAAENPFPPKKDDAAPADDTKDAAPKVKVSDDKWSGDAADYDDDQFEAACAACDDGDGPVKERCFLPHHEPDGTLNSNGLHAAAGRIDSVKASDDAVAKAKAHLKSHYGDIGEDPPDSLTAAGFSVEDDGTVTAEDGTALPTQWHAYLVVEGARTTDHRMFAQGSLTWRDLPLALEWNPEGNDHFAAGIVGSIDTIERQDEGVIYATGTFDLGSDIGREAARLNVKGLLRWLSIDAEVTESELVGDPFGGMDFLFWEQRMQRRNFHDEADEVVVEDWYEKFTKARIAGAHMVTIPAFTQAIIAPLSESLPKPVIDDSMLPPDPAALAACATGGAPPASWYSDPMLSEATPVTVLSNGRVFGHLATWGTCHIGFTDACVCAPKSVASYVYAMTGRKVTAEGDAVPCGHLTLGTGHAPLHATHHSAAAHYDDTGTVVADVAFGEDAIGIWYAGSLRSGVTEEQVEALRASAISGDWRTIGGNLELVAALCVNVPGFPVVASGAAGPLPAVVDGPHAGLKRYGDDRVQVSLVAAGITVADPMRPYREAIDSLQHEVAQLNAVIRPLLKVSRDALIARIDS